TGKEIRRWKDDSFGTGACLGFSPDGKALISIGGISDRLTVWDTANGKQVRQFRRPLILHQFPFGYENPTSSVAIAPDGKTVAAADGAAILLIDLDTGNVRKGDGHLNGLYNAYFTPDGKNVLTLANDGSSSRWDTANGKSLGAVGLPGQPGMRMTLPSPDGKSIAVSSWIGQDVVIYDAVTRFGSVFIPTEEPGKEPRGVRFAGGAFSPDEKPIAVVSTRGTTAGLFDTSSEKKKIDFRFPTPHDRNGNMPRGMAQRAWSPPIFSGDGRVFAVV